MLLTLFKLESNLDRHRHTHLPHARPAAPIHALAGRSQRERVTGASYRHSEHSPAGFFISTGIGRLHATVHASVHATGRAHVNLSLDVAEGHHVAGVAHGEEGEDVNEGDGPAAVDPGGVVVCLIGLVELSGVEQVIVFGYAHGIVHGVLRFGGQVRGVDLEQEPQRDQGSDFHELDSREKGCVDKAAVAANLLVCDPDGPVDAVHDHRNVGEPFPGFDLISSETPVYVALKTVGVVTVSRGESVVLFLNPSGVPDLH